MAMVINTNALSLNAQNNLNKSQQSLNTAIERLSSGSRINSAKDDAAGLAISNRMNSQVTGLNQANRNANDGISVAQTAEGALGQVTDNLQRIRELTVQSQNGTNQGTDLESIQNEISERLTEINRLSEQTQFNGKALLDGSSNEVKLQVGANDGQTISISLANVSADSLGLGSFSVEKSSLNVSTAVTSLNGDATAAPKAIDLSSAASTLSVDASKLSLRNVLDKNGAATDEYVVKSGDDYYAATVGADGAVTLNKTEVTYKDGDLEGTLSDQLIKVGANTDGSAQGFVTAPNGKNYQVTALDATASTVTTGTTVEFSGKGTTDPLATLDKALAQVDSLRSGLGAVQNRLQSTIEGNSTTSTNLSAAMSQIKDADYATEVSNMSKAQILQQAGTSVLAQANQTTQGVMSLLR